MSGQYYQYAVIWSHRFARFVSTLVIAVGTFAIIGWTFHAWLPHYLSSYIHAIKPLIALCCLASGVALWVRNQSTSKYMGYMAQVSSGLVFLIGFLTLFQYFFQINLGI